MSMVYEFKTSARFQSGFDRAAGAACLSGILERDGQLSIPAIVAEGADPASPIHPEFAISAEEAIDAFREQRADYLRRAFIVVMTDDQTHERREYRAVVPVNSPDDIDHTQHVSIVRAMADEDMRHQVLWRAMGELIAIRRKYRDLDELGRIFAAIDTAAKKIRKDIPA